MDKHLEKFKEYLKLNGHSSLNYYDRIRKFLREVKGEVSKITINSFILNLKENTKSAETVNSYINALKAYLKFLKKDITVPKYEKRTQTIPDRITLEYLEKQIIPVVECIFENPLKIKVILYFMFYTGVRRNEMLTLERKNIDLETREIKLLTPKVKREDIRFLPQKIADLVGSYFATEPEGKNAFNLKDNSIKYLFKTLKPHFKDIRLRPTLFRHSYATYLFENGASSLDLMDFLGHKSIQSTMKYVRRDKTIMKKKYDKFTRRK